MLTGSCYCGQIKYRIKSPINYVVHCHCRPCRKVTGAAFYSGGFIARSDFAITEGSDLVKIQSNIWNHQNPDVSRFYCGECGGRLGVYIDKDTLMNVAINTLDDEPNEDSGVHINVESKAPWYSIPASAEQHAQFPPDMSEQIKKILHN